MVIIIISITVIVSTITITITIAIIFIAIIINITFTVTIHSSASAVKETPDRLGVCTVVRAVTHRLHLTGGGCPPSSHCFANMFF